MTVVFLDFDGVMVKFEKKYKKMRPAVVSPEAVAGLNRIIARTGALIVVTSSWRAYSSVESLTKCVRKWGVASDIHDKTPMIPKNIIDATTVRGMEIDCWLALNFVESFVIFDDEEVAPFSARLIRTDPLCGLSRVDVARAIELLSEPYQRTLV